MNFIFRNSNKLISNLITFNKCCSSSLLVKNLTSEAAQPHSSTASTKLVARENSKSDIKTLLNHVNGKLVNAERTSRLFAVVMIGGSQFKVTTEDIIVVRHQFYPTVGDRIRLEKVLLVGGNDFTFVGKPMLSKEFVKIEATVIEKTLSNNMIIFTYKPRKDNKKMDFHKNVETLLRINSIEILGPVPGFEQKSKSQNSNDQST